MKRFVLFSSILLVLFSLISCNTEAVSGTVFLGKTYKGMSSEDLNSKNKNYKEVKLIFDNEHKAKIGLKNFFYYDTPLQNKNFEELKPLLYETIKPFLGDDNPTGEEAIESVLNLFNEMKTWDLFILSTKELDKIEVDFTTEDFNFSGYTGLGMPAGDDYIIYLISTKNVNKGYIFG